MGVEIVLEVGVRGDRAGKIVRANRPYVRLGRDPECEVSVDSDIVSRFHAEITLAKPNRWTIQDLESLNSTFLNRRRIATAELRIGDIIRLGEGGPKVRVLMLKPQPPESDDLEATRHLRVAAPRNRPASFTPSDITVTQAEEPQRQPKQRRQRAASPAPPPAPTPDPPAERRRASFPVLLFLGLTFGGAVGLGTWTHDALDAPARWLQPFLPEWRWYLPTALAVWYGLAGLFLQRLRWGWAPLLVMAGLHAAAFYVQLPQQRPPDEVQPQPHVEVPETPYVPAAPPAQLAPLPEAKGIHSVRRADRWVVYRRVHGGATAVRLNPILGQSLVVVDGETVFRAESKALAGKRLWIVALEEPAELRATAAEGDSLELLASGADERCCLIGGPSVARCGVFVADRDAESIFFGRYEIVPREAPLPPPSSGAVEDAALPSGLAGLSCEPAPGYRFRAQLPTDLPPSFPMLRAGGITQSLAATRVLERDVPVYFAFAGAQQVAGVLTIPGETGELPALGGPTLIHSMERLEP